MSNDDPFIHVGLSGERFLVKVKGAMKRNSLNGHLNEIRAALEAGRDCLNIEDLDLPTDALRQLVACTYSWLKVSEELWKDIPDSELPELPDAAR